MSIAGKYIDYYVVGERGLGPPFNNYQFIMKTDD